MKLKIFKYNLFFLALIFPLTLSAQKDVRKNVRKGNKAYQQQKFSEAFTFYNNALTENASAPEANYNVANTLYKQKEWDKSVEQYNHYLATEQHDAIKMSAAWHNIGNALLQKKELQKSMEAYKMALRLNPEDEETRYNLAVVQKMMQDQEEQQQDQQPQQQEDNQEQQQESPNNQNQPQKAEEPQEPEQMSRDNARQMLQAIEQDERETQEKVNKIKAEQRKKQAEDNRRNNKDW